MTKRSRKYFDRMAFARHFAIASEVRTFEDESKVQITCSINVERKRVTFEDIKRAYERLCALAQE